MTDPDEPLRAELEDRLRFETLLTDLSAHFVNLSADHVDSAIQDAQRRLVEALDLDRSTLFQLTADGTLSLTHDWSRLELPPLPPGFNVAEFLPWSSAKVLRGERIAFSSLDELPPGVRDGETIQQVGVKSSVAVPLLVRGHVVGVLTFATMRAERSWPEGTVNRLCLVAQVFASALERKRYEEELRTALSEVERLRDELTRENVYLRSEVKDLHGPSEIVGQSPAIRRALAQAEQVAATPSTVLLLGETGTGKELFASAIHDRSSRRDKPMVRVNCAAIPAALIESELFGREKGAYTGALARQIGRFELADGSTIFLDEVGDLPLELQVKLLRVLQEKQIERLGSSRPIKVDVRVIAATNRDLERAVADGAFREDLYYRLNVFPITVPPLRERHEDIPLLAWAFVDEFSRAFGKQIESVPKDNMEALVRYSWRGNVRELRNVVERAVIVANGPHLRVELPKAAPSSARRSVKMADAEREHIQGVLESTGWRVRGEHGAASQLGLRPSTLESRMSKLGIRRPRS